MNQRRYSSIPTPVFSVFIGLVPIGIALGVLYGTGMVAALAVSGVTLGGLAVFVTWAVLKLDPRRLSEVGAETRED